MTNALTTRAAVERLAAELGLLVTWGVHDSVSLENPLGGGIRHPSAWFALDDLRRRKEIKDAVGKTRGELKERGVKHDDGKLRMDLIPPVAMRQLGAVLAYGAAKYGDDNWKNHENRDGQRRHVAALLRHLTAWQAGELWDDESGLHHLAHALANAAFITHAESVALGRLPELYKAPPRTSPQADGDDGSDLR